ncbi:MAG: MBL fold metallo-hydrolase [Asgard group archaeon]|nr:MBL fold metallo-hydrolase [Asgard group archaeon]
MQYEEVANSVILNKASSGSNIVCIALKDELVFVDTGLFTETAAEFRREMESKFKRKTSTLLITHGHIDHFFAMNVFSDCKIVAAASGKQRFERFVSLEFTEEILENFSRVFLGFKKAAQTAKLRMPDLWIKDSILLGNNKELEFKVIGGHSNCSSSIYFSPEKILLVGDLIQADVYPYFGEPDTDMSIWIDNLKEWERMNINFILPGHGGILEKNYALKVRKFFEIIVEELKQMKQNGLKEEDMIKKPIFDQGYWPEDAIRKPAYDFSLVNLFRKS